MPRAPPQCSLRRPIYADSAHLGGSPRVSMTGGPRSCPGPPSCGGSRLRPRATTRTDTPVGVLWPWAWCVTHASRPVPKLGSARRPSGPSVFAGLPRLPTWGSPRHPIISDGVHPGVLPQGFMMGGLRVRLGPPLCGGFRSPPRAPSLVMPRAGWGGRVCLSTSFLPGKAASLTQAGYRVCAWLGGVRAIRPGAVQGDPCTRVCLVRV